jgi:hypothetical protein
VWFTIINRGGNVSAFRTEQDKLLQHLEKELEVSTDIPATLTPHLDNSLPKFGAANRNEVLNKSYLLLGAKHLEDKLSVIAKNSCPNASPVQLFVVNYFPGCLGRWEL